LSWQLDQQVPPQDPPTEQGDTVAAINVVSTGLVQPTAVDWLPDGTMLIAEKGGVVKTFNNSALSSTPFIDISDIVNGTRDRGLLDIAVHPDFANNPYVYLLFTYDPPEVYNQAAGTNAGPDGKGNRAGRLIRVTADASNGYLTAEANSQVLLLGENSTWDNFNAFANSTVNFSEPPAGELPDGSYLQDFINSDSESHTVGGLAFAPDGALYVSIGDGASYNNVDRRADRVQHIDSLSGKILRIDPLTGDGLPDNPFYNGDPDANRSKVYQLGLRNPFRIAVDPVTGQLFIGEVGWTKWEEINSSGPGANFGWPFYEGGSGVSLVQPAYEATPEGQDFFSQNVPVDASLYALNHQADGINAIVMGDVYRGSAYGAEYQGNVFFNDLGQGIVRHASIDASGNVTDVNVFATGANVVVQISEGPDGFLYFADLDDGTVGRWEIV
jgi:glucose/arabinose dehydrogenase